MEQLVGKRHNRQKLGGGHKGQGVTVFIQEREQRSRLYDGPPMAYGPLVHLTFLLIDDRPDLPENIQCLFCFSVW